MHGEGRVRIASTVAIAAIVAVALASAACSGSSKRTGGGPAGDSTGGAAMLPSSPDALPPFDRTKFDQLLGQLHGRPVVVNIWASWCGPCTQEAPELAKVARAFQGQVQFVGVDIADQVAPAKTFIHRYGWPYPSVFDPNGDIRDGFGLIGQPHTLVFDADGKRVFAHSGPVTASALSQELTQLVQD